LAWAWEQTQEHFLFFVYFLALFLPVTNALKGKTLNFVSLFPRLRATQCLFVFNIFLYAFPPHQSNPKNFNSLWLRLGNEHLNFFDFNLFSHNLPLGNSGSPSKPSKLLFFLAPAWE
jgi:hypothetical protein